MRRRGVALLYAAFGAFVAASMVGVMFTMAGVTNTRADTKRGSVEARYLAEGAVEAAKKDVLDAVANWRQPAAGGSVEIDGVPVPYTIEATGGSFIVEDAAGMQEIRTGYEIEATATLGDSQEVVRRIIHAQSTPLFQFAVFYINDLEIHPGPDMTLGGRVHTNGDMYLSCGDTLTLDTNYVHALGKMYRMRKSDGTSSGDVSIRQWVANPFDPSEPSIFEMMLSQGQMDDLGIGTSSGYDSFFFGHDADGDGFYDGPGDWLPFLAGALEMWGSPENYPLEGHTVLTGDHGLTESVTPSVGSIQMFEETESGSYALVDGEYAYVGEGNGSHDKGYFHGESDLSIIVAEDGQTFTIYGPGGDNDILTNGDLNNAVRLETIYDARQSDGSGEYTTVVKIDIEKLLGSSYWPANGLMYAAHYGMGEGADAKGVQIINGSKLASGLTVATEGSLYLQGDYNTVDKKGAAVIADAVSLLSNSWDGTKGEGDLPDAAETTYNCAMITGNYASEQGKYNGGLENLPRFHEAWSGVPCNFNGSFVNAWESKYATGLWKYGGDRYKAPGRNWAYDSMFNSVGNLPPYTPMAVTAADVVSW